jgi:hypothetical protein
VRRFAPQLFAQLFCISLFVFAVSNSQGQSPNAPNTQTQIANRELALRTLVPNSRSATIQYYDRLRLQAQVALQNDFRNLQIVNNQLMARVFEHSSIAYKEITQTEIRSRLGEIRKLAVRLRMNFGIPKLKSSEPAESLALKPGLLELDKAVVSFVENPFFQQPKVYDSELVSQAGRDITEVLRLTDALRRLTKEE